MSEQAVQKVEPREDGGEIVASPEAEGEAGAVLSMIERAARDPYIDVDKMERLFALKERMLDKQAEQAFNEAMREGQRELPRIVKNCENTETHSRYADLEAICAAIMPVITAHGFSLSFGTAESHMGEHYRVTCDVSHNGGHTRHFQTDIPLDNTGLKGTPNKTMTHAFGSSMTYGRRYLTLLIFNLVLTNEDDDGNKAGRGAVISDEQKAEIVALMQATGADDSKFRAYFNIGTLDDLPASKFADAKAMLEKKGKKK